MMTQEEMSQLAGGSIALVVVFLFTVCVTENVIRSQWANPALSFQVKEQFSRGVLYVRTLVFAGCIAAELGLLYGLSLVDASLIGVVATAVLHLWQWYVRGK